MKNHIAYRGIVAALLLVYSCEGVLDKDPYDSVPEEQVWANTGLSNLYLNNLYVQILPSFGASATSSMCDETVGENDDYVYGTLTAESVDDFSSDTYAKIRKINILLERIDNGGNEDAEGIRLIKGQALFLRAWVYWGLVNLYGGVPLVMNTQSLSVSGEPTPQILVKRSKTGVCIDSIVRDLDLAAAYLPNRWDDANYGRITRGAALALKGRVLLFWASPQFNVFDKQERWLRAYEANSSAIDTLLKDGYGLHPSFTELFNDCKEKTNEAIFVRVYDASIAGYEHGYDNGARPAPQSMNGSGTTNNPTWNLVSAFPMSNGYPTTDSINSGYRSISYWKSRDPRFYATVAYNASTWPLSGEQRYRIWTYYYGSGAGTLVSTEGSRHTNTGFYCKKYINPAILKANTGKVGTDWMEIRFTEVLLNFAECANETGNTAEAYSSVEQIRKRAWAGSPDIASCMGNISPGMSKEAMREAIMRERQVELAFENKRYWDLRRRNMFEKPLGENTPALNGTRRLMWEEKLGSTYTENQFKNMRDGFEENFNYATYFDRPRLDTTKLDPKQAISYPQPKYNFFAIPQTNLDKNPNLEQTSGWGGTFDPLAE
ncbi:MAG: RagB/SusD family nutrient uptake outer membrane protein [Prevotellaceae bacterium]|jgi:hypothetical protein|nr:RagB/SusD family nutrient uptake outer membrane protein [Prevotellaceae bacterium]